MENNQNYVIVGVLVMIAILVLVLVPKQERKETPKTVEVTDFMSCMEAGYPVMESYPAQCRTPDGKVYIEDLSEQPEVVVESVVQGQLVASPLVVTGKAKGNWFFEANIPVTLKDTTGKILAQKGAQAQGDWMTSDYVDFTVTLEFTAPDTQYGLLLIEKDNPSGMPENDAAYAIPVRFR